MTKTIRRARDAEKGIFVTMQYAQKHPKTTIVDRMYKPNCKPVKLKKSN